MSHSSAAAQSLSLTALAPDDPRVSTALFASDAQVRRTAASWLAREGAPIASLPAPRWPLSAAHYLGQVVEGTLRTNVARELTAARWRVIARAALDVLEDQARVAHGLAMLTVTTAGVVPRALIEAGLCPAPEHARSLGRALTASLTRLANAGALSVRAPALALLISVGGAEQREVLTSLQGDESATQRAVLEALATLGELPKGLRAPLIALFRRTDDWPTRRLAARALGDSMPAATLRDEPIALVREATRESGMRAPSCREGSGTQTAN